MTKEEFDKCAVEAVSLAIMEVQSANKVAIKEDGLKVLAAFGKKITDTLWDLTQKGN